MKLLYLSFLLLVAGCGQPTLQGLSCTVSTIGASTVAPNGGTSIRCPDGSQSLILNGTNGTNGASIIPIQFCKGNTAYPNTFPEVGFCINNQIYAVYSANDGFLTVIAPGVWESNAIGSRCTFTVKPNCIIEN